MARSKKNYKAREKALRNLKVLAPKKKGTSDDSRKRQIRRVEAKLKSQGINVAHGDRYISAPVPARSARELHEHNRAVIRSAKGARVIVQRQHATRLRFRKKDNALIHEFGNRQMVSYPYEHGPAMLLRVESFFLTKGKDDYLTYRVGGNNPFNITIHSMSDFEKYSELFETKMDDRNYLSPFRTADSNEREYRTTNPVEEGELQIVEVTHRIKERKPRAKRNAKKS